jgi:folate-binding protein YgfZ
MADVQTGYAAVRTAAGLIMRDDRRIVRVHGRDPVKMVNGLVTNDVLNAPVDRAVYAALLTPRGRMVGVGRVLRHGADLLLEVDAGALEGVLAHLKKFVPPLFAKFEDASAAYALAGVYGPTSHALAERVLGRLERELAEDDALQVVYGERSVQVIGTRYAGVAGLDLLVAMEDAEQIHAEFLAVGATPLAAAALDVLRIEAGQPRWGAELDETVIPLEAGLQARAISTSKGCYTGQEVIIRILHRGHVNWQLRGLLLGDAPVPARDTTLHVPGAAKSVARVTSACVSPRLQQTIALAYVRREIEPSTRLEFHDSDATAQVVELPFGELAAP